MHQQYMNTLIKFLVMDVDGTLTDGKIYMGADGELFKAFDIKDGYGIANMLPQKGMESVIITGRESKIVTNRCAELGIKYVFQNERNKIECLNRFIADYNAECDGNFTLRNVAYMGDDINDLECMKAVKKAGGLCACPESAVDAVKTICDFVSSKNGGYGAVREFIERIADGLSI